MITARTGAMYTRYHQVLLIPRGLISHPEANVVELIDMSIFGHPPSHEYLPAVPITSAYEMTH